MVDERALHLLRVLKDVDQEELIKKLNQIKENNDTHISHLFLEEYFRKKDLCISSEVYRDEAQCIVNIFPQYSVEYIESMLQTLGSENNRVVVILRQLLKNEPITNSVMPNEHAYSKACSLSNNVANNDTFNYCTQPTSYDFFPSNPYMNLRSTELKQDSVALLKRKSDVAQGRLSKIKVVPTASLCNSFSENRNNFVMPSTCNHYFRNEAYAPGTCNNYIGENEAYIPGTYTNYVNANDASTMAQSQVGFKPEIYPITNLFNSSYPNHKGKEKTIKPETNIMSINETYFDKKEVIVKPSSNIMNMNKVLPEKSDLLSNPDLDIDLENYLLSVEHINQLPKLEEDMHPSTKLLHYGDEPPIQLNSNVTTTNNYPENNKNVWNSTKVIRKMNTGRKKELPNKVLIPRNRKQMYKNREEEEQNMLEISSENEEQDHELDLIAEYIDEEQNSVYFSEARQSYDNKLVSKIMEMFPDASPTYVKQVCIGKEMSPGDIDDVVLTILSTADYPKRKQKEPSPDPDLDLEQQVTLLKEILPDADPDYLQYHAELHLQDKEKLKQFMSQALETKTYPTMKDYLRKQQLSAQVKQYTTDFNIEKFLEVIPDPDAYFNDPNKKSSLENNQIDVYSVHYVMKFLKNKYPTISIRNITSTFEKNKTHLMRTVKDLDEKIASGKYLMKTKRKPVSIDGTIQNIPLLQEIAYLTHQDEIKHYLEEKETKEKKEKEFARQNGLLRTCNCCYSVEVMPKDIVKCENGCDFCSECVKTSAEILFGEGKLDFPCLQACSAFFSLQTLKNVLSPKMFSKMARKKQLEEVKAAGIEELEMCPFCDFATIPAPNDKLFRCLNPECMKESCRQCKEPSHVPLRCDEIEKDDDVKRRTYIENKMTEALIRICYKCGMKFIKADGCNKMTCSCGAMMCYVCGEAVRDYKHFNGQGGDQYHLCPLYSDTNKLHQEDVIKGAEKAKAEIGVADDPKKLKIDPAADLHQHFKVRKSKNVHNNGIYNPFVHIDAVNHRLEAANQEIIAIARHPTPIVAHRHRHHHHRRGHHHYLGHEYLDQL